MSKNFCWGTNRPEGERFPYVVVLMTSRNKDNSHLEDFKERRKAMFCERNMDRINKKFDTFVSEGRPGEFCRLYVSLNARDEKKVQKALIHELIDNDNFNFSAIEGVVAGIAARKEFAAEKQWFFDFDSKDLLLLNEFMVKIKSIDNTLYPYSWETPHGYAVIVEHGFDTRELMVEYGEFVGLKRDDLICERWCTKE